MAAGSDYYKKLALECSSQQIAVDVFSFSSQFIDLSTICEGDGGRVDGGEEKNGMKSMRGRWEWEVQ